MQSINVLQIGKGDDNWADQYQLSPLLDWHYNDFSRTVAAEKKAATDTKHKHKKLRYQMVIFSTVPDFSADQWEDLHWRINPYCVFYTADVNPQANEDMAFFVTSQLAKPVKCDYQDFINQIPEKYFPKQSGIRFPPSKFLFNHRNVHDVHLLDRHHVQFKIDSPKRWINIGSFQNFAYLDPHKKISLWLERFSPQGIQTRLRVFVMDQGGDGRSKDQFVLDMDDGNQHDIPLTYASHPKSADVVVEMKGQGSVTLGNLHSRWSRDEVGTFYPGGRRIVNPTNHEDLAYLFNPGDLQPPLNVYFSGARSLEGFEAYPMFRNLHAPSLLFTDMRMQIGQFYTTTFFEDAIKRIINGTLKRLGFTNHDLVMNGISMGTYAAMKIGVQLKPYAINVCKPLTHLGYIAARGRLQRPDEFNTIYDITRRLTGSLSDEHLQQLDHQFWDVVDRSDLSQTRLFLSVMINDDYDNLALKRWQQSPATKQARQFSYKCYEGRHNDDDNSVIWFGSRAREITQHDFTRRKRS